VGVGSTRKVIPGKRIGRYIDESSQDDLWDIPEETEVGMDPVDRWLRAGQHYFIRMGHMGI
jgi:hypothetical protein